MDTDATSMPARAADGPRSSAIMRNPDAARATARRLGGRESSFASLH
jgi:hypothetical protein